MAKFKEFIRPMTKKEVNYFWDKLRREAEAANSQREACLTDDRQGVRFLAREEYTRQHYRKEFLEFARHSLVEILVNGIPEKK
jgi:hypothetical protein